MDRRQLLASGGAAALAATLIPAEAFAVAGDGDAALNAEFERIFQDAVTRSPTDQPKVANGASDLMVALFGEAGKHARAAVSAVSLPLGAAVEVDAVVQITTI